MGIMVYSLSLVMQQLDQSSNVAFIETAGLNGYGGLGFRGLGV